MKKIAALAAVAGLVGAANAAGNLVLSLIPREASIGQGGSVIVDIFADYSGVADGMSVAGWKFDIVGNANGSLAGNVNTTNFNNGVNHGVVSGANLNDFAGGQLPPGLGGTYTGNFLGTVTYTDAGTATDNYTVTLDVVDLFSPTGALNVYIAALGSQSRSHPSSSTGTNHTVTIDARPFDVIIPTPASMALLGLGGLVAGRRRR